MKTSERIRWALCGAVFLQAWGFYAKVWKAPSAINTTVFITLDASEGLAHWVDQGGALVVLVASALAFWWPHGGLLWGATLWMGVMALAITLQDGGHFARWAVFAWAARLAAPLTLWAWRHPTLHARAHWIARVGLSATFGMHGIEALWGHPAFIDLLSGAWRRFFGLSLDQEHAMGMLLVIGVVDLLCAGLVLWPKLTRKIAGYMVVWGAITALSRFVQWGSPGWPAVLLRASHMLLPLALFWMWDRAERVQPGDLNEPTQGE